MSIKINNKTIAGEYSIGISSMPIGTIYPVVASSVYTPSGALACNGNEYHSVQFNDFYTSYLIGGLLATCTYEEYTSDIETYGQCAKFALDTQNGTFKVPTIKDGSYITQAMNDSELGKVYKESLPNIKGGTNTEGLQGGTGTTSSGAIITKISTSTTSGSAGTRPWVYLGFDASKSSSVYQDDAKVQGDNIRLRYFVQIANGQINQSDMNWSEWATSLQNKLNLDISTNITNEGKNFISSLSMPSSKHITLTKGASGTQYTAPANGYAYMWTTSTNTASWSDVTNVTASIRNHTSSTLQGWGCGQYMPVKKGDKFSFRWENKNVGDIWFIYAEGEK